MALTDAFELLKLAAKHYCNNVAYVDPVDQQPVTYDRLLQQSTRLAGWMQSRGIARGDRIAVMLHNSLEVLQVHYAAAALHAVVVNVNTHWVDREINLVLQDSSPRLMFVHPHFLAAVTAATQAAENQSAQFSSTCSVENIVLVTSSAGSTLTTDQLELELACTNYASTVAAQSDFQPPSDLSDSDGYQMYYTSGTTGCPKGVLLSQRIVVTHALGTVQGESVSSGSLRSCWQTICSLKGHTSKAAYHFAICKAKQT